MLNLLLHKIGSVQGCDAREASW